MAEEEVLIVRVPNISIIDVIVVALPVPADQSYPSDPSAVRTIRHTKEPW